ncbi:Mediator of dna damage checkpoint protein [Thalictrum thalictroides]|uniref:Mediator of dna damage checkpoint protein n=1 Tax=Thalictrum thalictroides TaxID=46969 RepID=A0A7J6VTE2_THATH|nr:Mediator of dna damage checkpoint protein [Thalictrum thalictroides]
MGSIEDDDDEERNSVKGEFFNSNFNSNTEIPTQVLDSESSEIDCTVPVNDTVPIEQATQILEDLDIDEIAGTQVADSEDEGTNKTELLSESEGGTDDDSEKRNELIQEDGKKTVPSINTAIHASKTEHCGTGPAYRSFMSIRAESLRASGLAAAHKLNSIGFVSGGRFIEGGSQSGKDVVCEDSEVIGFNIQHSNGMQGRDVDKNHGALNCKEFVEKTRDETKCSVARSTARRLFTEDVPDNDSRLHELNANDPELAGLSYVESQEPGELSQANALNIVDKLIAVDDEDFPLETNLGTTIKGNTPPVSSAKRVQMLAQGAIRGSPVGEAGIFDWDDSHEDEGGGYLFSKRKEELLGGSFHVRRSYTQPKKSKPVNAKKGRGTVDKLREEKEDSKLRQKLIGLTHSDSRLVVHNLKENEKIQQVCKLRTRKNLVEELDEQLNLEVTTTDTKGCTRDETRKNTRSKKVYFQKGTSVPGAMVRRSKRVNTLDTNLSGETSQKNPADQEMNGLVSDSAVTGKIRKVNGRTISKKRNAANQNKTSDRISSESIDQANNLTAMNKSNINGSDRSHRSSTPNKIQSVTNRQMQEEHRIFTPVAHRTRKSAAGNPLQGSELLCSCISNGKSDVVIGEKKRQRIFDVDEQRPTNGGGKRSRLLSDLVSKDNSIQQEQLRCASHANIVKTSNEKRDGIVGALSTAHKVEANTRQKKLKDNVRHNGVKLDQKRVTRSSLLCNPSLLSSGKKSEEGLIRKPKRKAVVTEAALICSSPLMNEKLVRKDNFNNTSSGFHGRGYRKDCLSPVKAVQTSMLDTSPAGKVKQSGAACVTPSSTCTTPISDASPVCIGNGYHKNSCTKSLSRSPLTRELNRLDANEVLHSPASLDTRKRKDLTNVRVLFSHHLDEDIIRQQKKILVRLGAAVADSSSEATHFVTDKFMRTRNMLEAIACGKPVVTHLWLESCGQASCFIDEKNYILRDFKKEKEIKFSMPVSLARASQTPLLEGKRVFITPSIKPCKELIASLVRAVHGQAMERLGRSVTKDDKLPDDLLVISCEEDYAVCLPLLEKGAVVYGSELILNGIVIQKLEYGRHRLFTDHVRSTRSTIWLRKEDGEQFLPVAKREKSDLLYLGSIIKAGKIVKKTPVRISAKAKKVEGSSQSLGKRKNEDRGNKEITPNNRNQEDKKLDGEITEESTQDGNKIKRTNILKNGENKSILRKGDKEKNTAREKLERFEGKKLDSHKGTKEKGYTNENHQRRLDRDKIGGLILMQCKDQIGLFSLWDHGRALKQERAYRRGLHRVNIPLQVKKLTELFQLVQQNHLNAHSFIQVPPRPILYPIPMPTLVVGENYEDGREAESQVCKEPIPRDLYFLHETRRRTNVSSNPEREHLLHLPTTEQPKVHREAITSDPYSPHESRRNSIPFHREKKHVVHSTTALPQVQREPNARDPYSLDGSRRNYISSEYEREELLHPPASALPWPYREPVSGRDVSSHDESFSSYIASDYEREKRLHHPGCTLPQDESRVNYIPSDRGREARLHWPISKYEETTSKQKETTPNESFFLSEKEYRIYGLRQAQQSYRLVPRKESYLTDSQVMQTDLLLLTHVRAEDKEGGLYSSYASNVLSSEYNQKHYVGGRSEPGSVPVSSRYAFAGPSMSYSWLVEFPSSCIAYVFVSQKLLFLIQCKFTDLYQEGEIIVLLPA